MAVSSVELIVNAVKAINPLRQVEKASKKVEDAVENVNADLSKSKKRFDETGRSAKRASNSFDSLASSAAKLAAAYLTVNAAQNALRAGIARIESERRIQSLAKSYGEVAELQDAATKSAEKFGLGQTQANKSLADVFARLRPIGVGLSDIVSVYNGFNTAARLSGTTAAEASSAFRQLSQALGSGALRGDEFNSISEQIPAILTAISKETGIAQGDLRDYAAEGKLTADIVIRALKRIETEGAAQLESALGGPAQAITDFQNAAEDVQVALTRDIVPQMAEVFRGLAELIVNLEGPIRFIGGVAANTLNQINSLIVQATQPAAVAARRDIEAGLIPTNIIAGLTGGDVRGGAKQLFGEEGLKELEDRAREFSKLRGVGFQETLLQFMQDRLKTMDQANLPAAVNTPLPTFKPLDPLDKDKGKLTDQEKAVLATKEQIKNLREQQQISQGLTSQEREMLQLKLDIETAEKNRSLVGDDLTNALIEQLETTYGTKQVSESILQLNENQLNKQKELDNQKKKAQDAEKKRVEKLKQMYQQIGDTIASGVVEALQGAVRGTTSLAEAATNMLNSIIDQMLQLAVNLALFGNITGTFTGGAGGGILGNIFGGFLASGGTAQGGKSYIVGEKGPELFTPGRTGSVAPANSFGGSNIVVNVDASGSSVEGDGQQSRALGRVIGAAVQAEIVKQKMPGGLLA